MQFKDDIPVNGVVEGGEHRALALVAAAFLDRCGRYREMHIDRGNIVVDDGQRAAVDGQVAAARCSRYGDRFIALRNRVIHRGEGEGLARLRCKRRNSDGKTGHGVEIVARGGGAAGHAHIHRGIAGAVARIESGGHRNGLRAAAFVDAGRPHLQGQIACGGIVVLQQQAGRGHDIAVDGRGSRDQDGFLDFVDSVIHRREGEGGLSGGRACRNGQGEVRHGSEILRGRGARVHGNLQRRGLRPGRAVHRGGHGYQGGARVFLEEAR